MQDSAGSSGLSHMNGTPGGSPRPLISLGDDQLILIPRRIEATLDIYAATCSAGACPGRHPRYLGSGAMRWRQQYRPGQRAMHRRPTRAKSHELRHRPHGAHV
jgi:hypothetical protein